MYDVIVIGGGAAGLMAAGRAGERGLKVLLLEKNRRVGEKVRISGGGRCNITNAERDTRKLLKNYGTAEQALYSLFSQFGVDQTFSFFESHGVPLKVEARNRVFPVSDDATDVVRALEACCKKHGVTVLTGAPVTKVQGGAGKVESVRAGGVEYRASSYILATGGVSHPETGSTGDGFLWLKSLGHTVHKPTPTIVPLKTRDAWSKKLAGMTLPECKVTFFVDDRKAFALSGDVLCTHFGLSGPTILNSAHKVADLLYVGLVTARVDLFPKLDLGALDRTVTKLFEKSKNKALKNVLKELTPVARGVLELLTFDIEKKVHSISKSERAELVRLLKSLPVTVDGLMGFDRAVVADGGVPLSEIDMRTMRSKKLSNLYITGDLLHVRRPSGGFSLQLCWSTGSVAGSHVPL